MFSSCVLPFRVRSLWGWRHAHLEPMGPWNPLSKWSQAGFLGLHRSLAYLVPLVRGSPQQCAHFWTKGVGEEICLQRCGWKLGVGPLVVYTDTCETLLAWMEHGVARCWARSFHWRYSCPRPCRPERRAFL